MRLIGNTEKTNSEMLRWAKINLIEIKTKNLMIKISQTGGKISSYLHSTSDAGQTLCDSSDTLETEFFKSLIPVKNKKDNSKLEYYSPTHFLRIIMININLQPEKNMQDVVRT